MRLKRSLIVGVAAAALVLSGCAAGDADNGNTVGPGEGDLPENVSLNEWGGWQLERNEPVQGGTLRIGLWAPAESLDPAGPTSAASNAMMRAIFDQLFKTDDKGTITGDLAESIETDDGGTTWRMKLRSGITFTDGTPFNSAAVAAHIARTAAPDSRSSNAGNARNMVGLETPDDTTLIITLAKPTMGLPYQFTTTLGYVPSPTAVEQLGSSFTTKPVGAGPFMVESYVSNGDGNFVRNPDYYQDGLPYLDKIVFVNATDTQSRLAAAVAGDLDLGNSQSGVDLRSAENQGLLVLYQPSSTYFNFLFNLSLPPFDDIRFREAVMRGIDLDAVNQAVFDGLNKVQDGMFLDDNPYYIDTDWPMFDAEKAKELIEDWQADTGLEPEFTLTTTSPPEFQQQAAIMQQMLADVGITMNVNVGDQPTMITEALAGTYNSQHRYFPFQPEIVQTFWNNFHSGSALNISHAGDPKVDEILDQAILAQDEATRADLMEQLQEAMRDWLPFMPQIRHTNGWYVNDTVGGFPGTTPGGEIPDFRLIYISQ